MKSMRYIQTYKNITVYTNSRLITMQIRKTKSDVLKPKSNWTCRKSEWDLKKRNTEKARHEIVRDKTMYML